MMEELKKMKDPKMMERNKQYGKTEDNENSKVDIFIKFKRFLGSQNGKKQVELPKELLNRKPTENKGPASLFRQLSLHQDKVNIIATSGPSGSVCQRPRRSGLGLKGPPKFSRLFSPSRPGRGLVRACIDLGFFGRRLSEFRRGTMHANQNCKWRNASWAVTLCEMLGLR